MLIKFSFHNFKNGFCQIKSDYNIKSFFLALDFGHKGHSISNRKFCCFYFIIAMVHQNSPTVELLQEKIEGNLRRANTEPSVDFRRAITEPSVDFRKANTEPSVNFRRANTRGEYSYEIYEIIS